MDTRDYLNRIKADAEAALEQLGPAPAAETLVKAGDSLQAALDKGGAIRMESGAIFAGNFVAAKAGTRLTGGPGVELRGAAGGPAFMVPSGARDIQASAFRATTAWDQSVVLLGENEPKQGTPDSAPAGILLAGILVPKHRGKRAFEINAQQTVLMDCGAADVFDPAGRDSQAIWIGNSPGQINVQGGSYSAGSEVILIGGGGGTQAEKIVPQGMIFNGVRLVRPLSWKTDGVKRTVKTSFEVKTGRNVTLENSTIDGVWRDGQSGYAVTITPRDGGDIKDVVVDTLTIRNAGAGFNIASHDDLRYSPQAQRIKLARVICVVEKQHGAGRFVQLGGEVQGLELEGCQFEGPDSIVLSYASTVWDSPTASRSGYVSRGVKLTGGNSFKSGAYGLMLTGAVGAGAYGVFWKEAWPDGVIYGNTFGGASGLAHKKNLPADNFFTA